MKPVGTYVAAGTFDLVYPTGIADALGVTHTLNFKRVYATIESSDGTFRAAGAKVTAGNKVRVYTYNSTPVLADHAGQVVTVWVR